MNKNLIKAKILFKNYETNLKKNYSMDLIIGANGFLGRNVSESIQNSLRLTRSGVFKNGLKVYDSLEKCISKEPIKNIFNCAVSYNEKNLDELNNINYELPNKLIELTSKRNIRIFFFGSFFEKEPQEYMINYINSKLKLYKLIKRLNRKNIFYLRLEHIFGKHDREKKFLPTLVNKIKNQQSIVLNDPFTVRDFTPVDHVVNSCLIIKNKSQIKKNFFNIGTGKPQLSLAFIYKLINFYTLNKPELFLEINKLITINNNKQKVIRFSYASDSCFSSVHQKKYFSSLEEKAFNDLFFN